MNIGKERFTPVIPGQFCIVKQGLLDNYNMPALRQAIHVDELESEGKGRTRWEYDMCHASI